MNVFRILGSGILLTNADESYFGGMLALAEMLNIPDEQRPTEADLIQHRDQLPPGQYVAVDVEQNRVVGAASCLQTDRSPHDLAEWGEICGGRDFSAHDAAGEWLFGAHFWIDPDYSDYGIGNEFFTVRMALAKTLHLAGFYEHATDAAHAAAADRRGYKQVGQVAARPVIYLENVMR